MQASNEIKEVVQAIYTAMSKGSAEGYASLQSREAGTLVIGTDVREWWSGYEDITYYFGQQFSEMGGTVEIEGSGIEAFSEGSVGWAADHVTFILPDGTRIPLRMTFVFHQEEQSWKLVQRHVSVGATNKEVVGKELTI